MPAGFVPTDPSLSSTAPAGLARTANREGLFTERRLSNDISRFYGRWLYPGSHTVTYFAQAEHAGEFTALPAKIESLYQDGVFATTEASRVMVD